MFLLPPPFIEPASVMEVLIHLHHLHDQKLFFSAIYLQRSAISRTFTPVVGIPVGELSLVRRLLLGFLPSVLSLGRFLHSRTLPRS